MILKKSFENFVSNIALDDTRAGKIQSAHANVRECLRIDQEISALFYETFLQGSYRLGTAVRPQGEGEYDVDVILAMNLTVKNGATLYSSKSVIEWVAKRLELLPQYQGKITARERCVEIKYSGGFYMDIVPSHQPNGEENPIQVPTHWHLSHPKGFKLCCEAWNKNSNQRFLPIVKMLKWWRNIHFGDDGSPKSILLTTLIGNHLCCDARSLDEALVKTMESIKDFLNSHIFVPSVFNPSLLTENLASRWEQTDYDSFKIAFTRATTNARKALDSKYEVESIALWNSTELFQDTFPKRTYNLEEEARAIANSLSTGTLRISSTGLINPSTGQTFTSPATRHFGST